MSDTTVYLPLDCLAARLHLPRSYLRELAEAREIPVLDLGNGRLRFDEAQVRDALRQRAAGSPVAPQHR